MKFIIGKDGESIINAEQVQAVYICRNADMNEYGDFIPDGSIDIKFLFAGQENARSLIKFDGDDADANFSAAKAYIAELAGKLNGGDAS